MDRIWIERLAKIGLLIVTSPVWWPIAKLMWRELNDALREEGGLIGMPPNKRQLEAMRRERRREVDALVNEPRASVIAAERKGRGGSPGRAASPGRAKGGSGPRIAKRGGGLGGGGGARASAARPRKAARPAKSSGRRRGGF